MPTVLLVQFPQVAVRILVGLSKTPFSIHSRWPFCKLLAEELSKRRYRVEVVRTPYPDANKESHLMEILAAQLFTLPASEDDVYLALDEIAALAPHPRKVVWLGEPMERLVDAFPAGRTPMGTSQIFATTASLSARLFRQFGVSAPVLYPRPEADPGRSGDRRGESSSSASHRPVVVTELEKAGLRIDLLLDAMASLPVHPLIRLVCDEPARMGATRNLARLEEEGKLEFWPRSELRSAFAEDGVHLFLEPSEKYPESALGSLGAGRTVVATTDSPVVEFIRHGIEGLLVRPRADELASTLRGLLLDRGTPRPFETRARATFRNLVPSWSETIQTLLDAA